MGNGKAGKICARTDSSRISNKSEARYAPPSFPFLSSFPSFLSSHFPFISVRFSPAHVHLGTQTQTHTTRSSLLRRYLSPTWAIVLKNCARRFAVTTYIVFPNNRRILLPSPSAVSTLFATLSALFSQGKTRRFPRLLMAASSKRPSDASTRALFRYHPFFELLPPPLSIDTPLPEDCLLRRTDENRFVSTSMEVPAHSLFYNFPKGLCFIALDYVPARVSMRDTLLPILARCSVN